MIRSTDVHVSTHAIENLLIRYSSDLLPRSPVQHLLDLVDAGRPVHAGALRQLSAWAGLLYPTQRLLATQEWVLALRPERHPAPARRPWVLVTVLSRDSAANAIPRALREDRLINARAFANGDADHRLAALVEEMARAGDTSLSTVARVWRSRGLPRHEHGGFARFEDFARDAVGRGVIAVTGGGLHVVGQAAPVHALLAAPSAAHS